MFDLSTSLWYLIIFFCLFVDWFFQVMEVMGSAMEYNLEQLQKVFTLYSDTHAVMWCLVQILDVIFHLFPKLQLIFEVHNFMPKGVEQQTTFCESEESKLECAIFICKL